MWSGECAHPWRYTSISPPLLHGHIWEHDEAGEANVTAIQPGTHRWPAWDMRDAPVALFCAALALHGTSTRTCSMASPRALPPFPCVMHCHAEFRPRVLSQRQHRRSIREVARFLDYLSQCLVAHQQITLAKVHDAEAAFVVYGVRHLRPHSFMYTRGGKNAV